MTFKITDFKNNKKVIITNKPITNIHVLILSGDEVITINYEDGTFEKVDSCDIGRLIPYYDGQYTVSKQLLQQWIALEELSSYERQNKFDELLYEKEQKGGKLNE